MADSKIKIKELTGKIDDLAARVIDVKATAATNLTEKQVTVADDATLKQLVDHIADINVGDLIDTEELRERVRYLASIIG